MSIYDFEDYSDFENQNVDYLTIIENFGNTILYEETLHFLQIAFPEWNSNAGVGEWAAEFLLNVLRNKSYLLEEEYSFREMLVGLYPYLAESYDEYKKEWKNYFNLTIIDRFEEEYEEVLELNSHLDSDNFNILYNDMLKDFITSKLRNTTALFF